MTTARKDPSAEVLACVDDLVTTAAGYGSGAQPRADVEEAKRELLRSVESLGDQLEYIENALDRHGVPNDDRIPTDGEAVTIADRVFFVLDEMERLRRHVNP